MTASWLRPPGRLWRTLRPLPAASHVHRATHMLRKRGWRPWLPALVRRWRRAAATIRSDDVALRRLAGALAMASAAATEPTPRRAATALGATTRSALVLAGRRIDSLPPRSWHLHHARPLERYEAHYLGWAEALVAADDLALAWRCVESWHGAAAAVAVAWEPYPRSRRALHCLRAAARLIDRADPEAALLRRWLLEIAATAAQPLPRLQERHLGGNHLLTNLLAIAADAYANQRRPRGSSLSQVWRSQFFPDGSHAEGSPMYHAQALEDALTVAALAGPRWPLHRELSLAMGWLRRLQHPGGQLPAFGDTDPSALGRLPLVCAALLNGSGGHTDPTWSAWTADADEAHVVVRVGQLAWPDQPGHAHADGLTIEFSVGGQLVLCDAGISGYSGDPMRSWDRSEAAHSVIEVRGDPQLELWGDFRVGARGATRVISAGVCQGWRWLAAQLDWPDARHVQVRFVALAADGSLYVCDQMRHRGPQHSPHPSPAVLRLRLHEHIHASGAGGRWRVAGGPLPSAEQWRVESALPVTIERSRRHPTLGSEVPTETLTISLRDARWSRVLFTPSLHLDRVAATLAPALASLAERVDIR